MPDYDLSGLSPRTFQQLVASACVALLGAGVRIYGDGPDGGRDVTFEGTPSYPFEGAHWEGYGVVQAKYRQRPEGTKSDTKWLAGQLTAELQRYQKEVLRLADPLLQREERKTRRIPDYYIIATNLNLSSVTGTGGKDKIRELLGEYAPKIDLKGFDVWDYDTFRHILDKDAELRLSYSAWITAGDVLGQIAASVQRRAPYLQKALRAFLQKELLADQYADLDRAGHAARSEQVSISRVFVDIPELASHEQLEQVETPNADGLLPSGVVHQIIEEGEERNDPVFPRRNAIGIVLVGGPGAGKSTITQFTCQLYRAAILREVDASSLSYEVSKIVTTITENSASQGLSLPRARRIPVRISLSHYARLLASSGPPFINGIADYLAHMLSARSGFSVGIAETKELLAGYPWLIIFDGLDEVPASSNRGDVLQSIQEFWVDIALEQADLLVVATTRPQGYAGEFASDTYRHVGLAPLSSARALRYSALLAHERYGHNSDRETLVLERLGRAITEKTTAHLMRSPLQVTIMASLVDTMGQPPEQRWKLFNAYYSTMFARERDRDTAVSAVLRDHEAEVLAIHRRVGLALHVANESTGRTDSRLTHEQFDAIVLERLREEGHSDGSVGNLVTLIREAASQRLVFLVEPEDGVIGFELRSLQEFMAAEALLDAPDPLVQDRFQHVVSSAHWRNVTLFMAGHCFAERQYLRDTLYAICGRLDSDPTSPVGSSLRAGSRLALDIMEDASASHQPKYANAFALAALRLLDLPEQTNYRRLSYLYQDGLAPAFTQITPRLQRTNILRDMGAWNCIVRLAEAGVDWATQWIEAAFGSDEIDASGLAYLARLEPSPLICAALAYNLPRVPPNTIRAVGGSQTLGLTASAFSDGIVPRWVKAIDTALGTGGRSRGPQLVVAFPSTGGATLAACALAGADEDAGDDLIGMPRPCDEWLPYLGAARLSASPHPRMLAAILEGMGAATSLSGLVTDRIPWPLASCLVAMQGGTAVGDLCRRAGEGQFGTADAWVRAEARWAYQLVSANDFAAMTDDAWPIPPDVAIRGFPAVLLGAAPSLSVRRPGLVNFLLAMMSEFSGSNYRLLEGALALAVSHGVLRERLKLTERQARRVLSGLRRLAVGVFPVEFLDYLDEDTIGASDAWAMLNDLSQTLTLAPGSISPSTAVRLSEALRDCREPFGLVRLAAYVSGDWPKDALTDVVTEAQGRLGALANVSCALARLNLVEPGDESAAIAVPAFSDTDIDDATRARFVELLSRQGANISVSGPLLLNITRWRDDLGAISRDTINMMQRLFDSAPSGMAVRSVWEKLGLPENVGRIVWS